MAIDTESKRRSVYGYTPGSCIAPLADASVDDADRYHMAWIYAGTSPSGAPTFQSAWAIASEPVYIGFGGLTHA